MKKFNIQDVHLSLPLSYWPCHNLGHHEFMDSGTLWFKLYILCQCDMWLNPIFSQNSWLFKNLDCDSRWWALRRFAGRRKMQPSAIHCSRQTVEKEEQRRVFCLLGAQFLRPSNANILAVAKWSSGPAKMQPGHNYTECGKRKANGFLLFLGVFKGS